jgi:type IV pilus assembly protein PilE
MTLIELMTVMAVVAILGTIAIGSYRQMVVRAQRTDATAALVKAAAAQEKWYLIRGTYADTATLAAAPPGGLGVAPERGFYTLTVTTVAGLATDYTVTATPAAGSPQGSDAKCTSFSINNQGQKAATGTLTAADCWK